VNSKFPPNPENMNDPKSSVPIPSRPWRVIAEELTGETSLAKIFELSEELSCALRQVYSRLKKERVVASDIAGCDFMAGSEDQQVYLQTGIRACQTTPLIGRGGIIVGMISTHWRTPHQPSEKDLRLFDALAMEAVDLVERCS
jgi:GAF domain-containing protein